MLKVTRKLEAKPGLEPRAAIPCLDPFHSTQLGHSQRPVGGERERSEVNVESRWVITWRGGSRSVRGVTSSGRGVGGWGGGNQGWKQDMEEWEQPRMGGTVLNSKSGQNQGGGHLNLGPAHREVL